MKRYAMSAAVLGIALVVGCGRIEEGTRERGPTDPAASSPVREFSRTITIEELKEHVDFLASDALEGRHSGTRGAAEAADYLARHFRELGLLGGSSQDGSYFQKFRMTVRRPVECLLESEHGRVDNWVDFMEMHSDFSGEKEIELVWAGYGRDSDLEGLAIEGKLVAFFQGTPGAEIISNDRERVKIGKAAEMGAAGTLLIVRDDPPFLDFIRKLKPYFVKERYDLSVSTEDALRSKRRISISLAGAARLLGWRPGDLRKLEKEADGGVSSFRGSTVRMIRMATFYEDSEAVETTTGENVLGYLEGEDEGRQCLVLTAHYDHLGRSGMEIYNGACDNASGVAALLEIAEAFAMAARDGRRPRRSVVFLFPDAEELGGLGSRHYLEHPLFLLSDTLADLNIDEIGREDSERPNLKDFVLLYLSRNGITDLREIRDRAVDLLPPELRIEIRENYAGSDHAFFEELLIPAVAFSTGHPADHHLPTDTADKIDCRNVRDIARLAFSMAWEIAFGETTVGRIIAE